MRIWFFFSAKFSSAVPLRHHATPLLCTCQQRDFPPLVSMKALPSASVDASFLFLHQLAPPLPFPPSIRDPIFFLSLFLQAVRFPSCRGRRSLDITFSTLHTIVFFSLFFPRGKSSLLFQNKSSLSFFLDFMQTLSSKFLLVPPLSPPKASFFPPPLNLPSSPSVQRRRFSPEPSSRRITQAGFEVSPAFLFPPKSPPAPPLFPSL